MRAAIVGCGAIAPIHINALLKRGETIVALCDPVVSRAEELKNSYSLDCKIYDDYAKMLESAALDSVHICTPHNLHAPMSIAALEKNINVLCEKPVCKSPNEIEALRKAVLKSKAVYGVCLQNRFLNGVAAAREYLEGKKILDVSAELTWQRDAAYYEAGPWRGKKSESGGGLLINQAIHTLDLMQFLTGMPETLKGSTSLEKLQGLIDVENVSECSWRIGNVPVTFSGTTSAQQSLPVTIKISSANGLLELIGGDCYIDGKLIGGNAKNIFGKSCWGDGHDALIAEYYNCLKEKRAFSVSFEEGLKALKIVFAIYKSNNKEVMILK